MGLVVHRFVEKMRPALQGTHITADEVRTSASHTANVGMVTARTGSRDSPVRDLG